MAFTESYIFRSFLKTIILVVVLGALHGLVVLPVLLTIFHCGDSEIDDDTTSSKGSSQTNEGILVVMANDDNQMFVHICIKHR